LTAGWKKPKGGGRKIATVKEMTIGEMEKKHGPVQEIVRGYARRENAL